MGIDLHPGETAYSQTSTMAGMTAGMRMHTNTGGGFYAGLARSFSGCIFFITDFTAEGGPGHIAFAPRFPGSILARTLRPGESLICRKETFSAPRSR